MFQVVENLRQCGLFELHRVRVLWTHDRGSGWVRTRMFLSSFAKLAFMIAARRVSLIHAHVAMRGSFWRKSCFLALGLLFRRPTILHLHGSQFVEFYEHECGKTAKFAVRFIFEHVTTVIVLSEQWRIYVRGLAPRARIVTVRNFVNADALQLDLARSTQARSSSTILFLGEIGQRKGIYDLVRALPRIVAAVPGARLVAGGMGELDQVRRCAEEIGVERHLELPGWVSGREKIRLLAEAAVYVLPSYNEGLPISILEAMACNLPVVSTSVGGIPEAIRDGEEGFLVAPGAIGDLSDRIIELLSDGTLRQDMGKRAGRRLETEFSATNAVSEISEMYLELLRTS